MKGRNIFITGLIVALVGVLMIIFHSSLASGGIIVAAGILFVGAGVLNMLVFMGSRDKNGRARMGAVGTAIGWIASAAAVVLGLSMLIFSKAFVALVGFMFAVLLLFAALFQFFLLLFGSRPARLSNWFFIVPALLVAAAVFIFMRKPDTAGESLIMAVTGGAFIVFGGFTMLEGSLVGNVNRGIRKGTRDAAGQRIARADEKATEKTGGGVAVTDVSEKAPTAAGTDDKKAVD